MPWYSKNGWPPETKKDNTSGWVEVEGPPTEVPQDKELVWLNMEWIIRDPKPVDRPGYQWNWQHDTKSWVEGAWQIAPLTEEQVQAITETAQVSNLTTAQL